MQPAPYGGLGIALALGFAPAAFIGVPGLSGLVAAIVGRIAYGAYLRRRSHVVARGALYATQQLTEVCFYLGALASWPFV